MLLVVTMICFYTIDKIKDIITFLTPQYYFTFGIFSWKLHLCLSRVRERIYNLDVTISLCTDTDTNLPSLSLCSMLTWSCSVLRLALPVTWNTSQIYNLPLFFICSEIVCVGFGKRPRDSLIIHLAGESYTTSLIVFVFYYCVLALLYSSQYIQTLPYSCWFGVSWFWQ